MERLRLSARARRGWHGGWAGDRWRANAAQLPRFVCGFRAPWPPNARAVGFAVADGGGCCWMLAMSAEGIGGSECHRGCRLRQAVAAGGVDFWGWGWCSTAGGKRKTAVASQYPASAFNTPLEPNFDEHEYHLRPFSSSTVFQFIHHSLFAQLPCSESHVSRKRCCCRGWGQPTLYQKNV